MSQSRNAPSPEMHSTVLTCTTVLWQALGEDPRGKGPVEGVPIDKETTGRWPLGSGVQVQGLRGSKVQGLRCWRSGGLVGSGVTVGKRCERKRVGEEGEETGCVAVWLYGRKVRGKTGQRT
eukprot:3924300-Rhodomonas_salina.1